MTERRRVAIVIRGPPGAGKTTLLDELVVLLSKRMGTKRIVLDEHSGFPSNHRPRSFHNFDSLSEECVLIELGDGGDATRSPEKWAGKLREQGYAIHLFLLEAPLDVLKERTSTRKDWESAFTFGAWNSYRYDPNFIELPRKLGLSQLVIDTSKVRTAEAARRVVESMGEF